MSARPADVAARDLQPTISQRQERLTRFVAHLQPGDMVRVHLNGKSEPVVGVLRRSLNHHIWGTPSLFLDTTEAHIVRDWSGRPGYAVRDIERYDVDTRFDKAMDQAEVWLGLREAHSIAPAAEREALQNALDEAKNDFIAEWITADPRSSL